MEFVSNLSDYKEKGQMTQENTLGIWSIPRALPNRFPPTTGRPTRPAHRVPSFRPG